MTENTFFLRKIGIHCFRVCCATLLSYSALCQENMDVFAHRGFRGLHPENTIEAMEKTLDLGNVYLEMDVLVSEDNQIIVSHDFYPNTNLLLDGAGKSLPKGEKRSFYQLPYSTIKSYIIGAKTNKKFPDQLQARLHIPLFANLLDNVEAYAKKRNQKPIYVVETKLNPTGDHILHPDPEHFVALLMPVLYQKGITDRIIIQSFDPRSLQVIHEKYPEIPLLFLAKKDTQIKENIKMLGFVPTYYSADPEFLDSNLVTTCRQLGTIPVGGNCNDIGELRRMSELGIKYVISDYPLDFLRQRKSASE